MTATTTDVRQVHTTDVILRPGLSPVAKVHRYGFVPPLAAVQVMDGLTVQSSDVQALRDLSDAFHTAASELHAARMEWDEAQA